MVIILHGLHSATTAAGLGWAESVCLALGVYCPCSSSLCLVCGSPGLTWGCWMGPRSLLCVTSWEAPRSSAQVQPWPPVPCDLGPITEAFWASSRSGHETGVGLVGPMDGHPRDPERWGTAQGEMFSGSKGVCLFILLFSLQHVEWSPLGACVSSAPFVTWSSSFPTRVPPDRSLQATERHSTSRFSLSLLLRRLLFLERSVAFHL